MGLAETAKQKKRRIEEDEDGEDIMRLRRPSWMYFGVKAVKQMVISAKTATTHKPKREGSYLLTVVEYRFPILLKKPISFRISS